MTTFLVLLKRMIALLFMMACGYYSYKKKWVGEEGYSSLSTIVANILNPILLFNAVITADRSIGTGQIVQNLILVGIYYVLLIVLGIVIPIIIRAKGTESYQYNLMTIFSNVGFMAIPVLAALYGNGATIYIVFYVLVYNVLIYSYGLYLTVKTKGDKAKYQLKSMINPGFIGSILAILLYASGVEVGDPFTTICGYMGDATIPMSMFITGISIAKFPVREYLASVRVYIYSVIKLLIIPIAAALIIKGFPLDEMVKNVFVMEIAMPVGALVLALNRNYGANEIVTSRGIVITTILSIITIPLVSLFL
ncbi:AEC family transporter [Agathobacter ruminis]|uniref:Transporter n=1 Tax=Agathobacter ruminis TaxID=1712665 RepID=A0A2G3E5A3_9FIRM|nr:AEC family transporter [Agathobacter ruminis]MDC7301102.1 AEC family transporter [Agathobacter ruminis]PHU38434.1 hypothetical protein CSX02_02550 [Agathobacter ruminis]